MFIFTSGVAQEGVNSRAYIAYGSYAVLKFSKTFRPKAVSREFHATMGNGVCVCVHLCVMCAHVHVCVYVIPLNVTVE